MSDFNATFTDAQQFGAAFGESTVLNTGNYEDLYNKPRIEDVELIGNKTFKQLGMEAASVPDIERILYLN